MSVRYVQEMKKRKEEDQEEQASHAERKKKERNFFTLFSFGHNLRAASREIIIREV